MDQLNALDPARLREHLAVCCAADAWVDAMVAKAPFASAEQLFAGAAEAWAGADEAARLQAFGAHPRIGEQALRAKFGTGQHASWSAGEQAGAADAAEATLKALAEGNDAYFDRFGFTFIICATGLGAETMLAALQQRLGSDRAADLDAAAEQQGKITAIRLEKLIAQLGQE